MSKLYRGGSLATSGLSAGHGRSARNPLCGLTNRGGQTGPGRLVRCELLPQVSHQLGDLTVGQTVLEGRHVAEIACGGGRDALQDHLGQIVGLGAVQIAVQRPRRPAAQHRRAAPPLAKPPSPFIQTRPAPPRPTRPSPSPPPHLSPPPPP